MGHCREQCKNKEILLACWLKLGEIKDLVCACKRGYDAELKSEYGEIRSVLSIVEDRLENVIKELAEATD